VHQDAASTAGRRQRKKDATRAALYEAGVELFTTMGLASTTVRDITERADVAERTFYRYFASKEDLLLEAARLYFKAVEDMVARRPAGERPLECLVAVTLEMEATWPIDAAVTDLTAIVMDSTLATGRLHQMVDEHQEVLSGIFAARLGLAEADYRCHLYAAAGGTAFIQALGRNLVDPSHSVWAYGLEALRALGAGLDPHCAAGIDPLVEPTSGAHPRPEPD
jgi:AcrR family transcriptional regulator